MRAGAEGQDAIRALISAIDVWKYIHILLFVYWLGADLGVFLLALASKRRNLSFPERALALKMAWSST